jgi:hypothetical protein
MSASHYWTPTVDGEGRAIGRPARIHRRTIPVRLCGRNPFEPVRVRVQLPCGGFACVDPCELVGIEREVNA